MVTGSLYALGYVILMSTHLYLIEQYVCREYHASLEPLLDDNKLFMGSDIPLDETLCKKPAIQSTVAGIQGTYLFLSLTPCKAMFL